MKMIRLKDYKSHSIYKEVKQEREGEDISITYLAYKNGKWTGLYSHTLQGLRNLINTQYLKEKGGDSN